MVTRDDTRLPTPPRRSDPRQMPPERAVAAFDSASAFLRATARGLRGEDFARLGQGVGAGLGARATMLLPERLRRAVYTAAGAREGVPPERLGDIDGADVARWIVGHYRSGGPYPVVFLGSSNGALTHLCTALGAPWLPQTLLVPVRWAGNDPDRPDAAMTFGRGVAPPLLARNPDLALHHMHDGNQDRLMVATMAYFRMKRRRLGHAYREFLRGQLASGAPIVLVDDTSRWPVTTVADRHVFQTGARGGLAPAEYRRGSLELDDFRAAEGAEPGPLPAPEPDTTAPEAEWGYDDELTPEVLDLAAETGHPVYRMRLDEPEALSPVVAELFRRRHDGNRLLVESFIMLDPVQANRIGAAPFWTVFGVADSAAALARYLDATEPYDDIDVTLFSHGVRSAGLADADTWRDLAARARRRGRLLAVRPGRYPVDFASLARITPALRRIPSAYGPARRIVLADLADEIARWPGITWTRESTG